MPEIVNPSIEEYLRGLYDDGDPVRREMEELAAASAASRSWGRWSAASLQRADARHRRAPRVRAGLRLRLLRAALRPRGGRGRERALHGAVRGERARWPRASSTRAGVWDRVTYHREEATAALRRVGGTWDIVYNDIDKDGYPDTVELAYAHLRPGGLFITDNVLWSGRVLEGEDDGSPATRGRQGVHAPPVRPPGVPHHRRPRPATAWRWR